MPKFLVEAFRFCRKKCENPINLLVGSSYFLIDMVYIHCKSLYKHKIIIATFFRKRTIYWWKLHIFQYSMFHKKLRFKMVPLPLICFCNHKIHVVRQAALFFFRRLNHIMQIWRFKKDVSFTNIFMPKNNFRFRKKYCHYCWLYMSGLRSQRRV